MQQYNLDSFTMVFWSSVQLALTSMFVTIASQQHIRANFNGRSLKQPGLQVLQMGCDAANCSEVLLYAPAGEAPTVLLLLLFCIGYIP